MARENVIYLGSELKFNVHIEPIGNVSMSDYDFMVELFTGKSRTVTIKKEDALFVDKDNYKVKADTETLGIGRVIALVTCLIPDADFDDGVRTEILRIDTGIDIVKAK